MGGLLIVNESFFYRFDVLFFLNYFVLKCAWVFYLHICHVCLCIMSYAVSEKVRRH